MKYYNYPNGTKTAEALDSENTSVVKGPDGKYLVPNELPAITANDKGKIVRVKADGTGIEYTGEAELPPITSADGGKVCKVKSDHSGVEWGEAGGSAFDCYVILEGSATTNRIRAYKSKTGTAQWTESDFATLKHQIEAASIIRIHNRSSSREYFWIPSYYDVDSDDAPELAFFTFNASTSTWTRYVVYFDIVN